MQATPRLGMQPRRSPAEAPKTVAGACQNGRRLALAAAWREPAR